MVFFNHPKLYKANFVLRILYILIFSSLMIHAETNLQNSLLVDSSANNEASIDSILPKENAVQKTDIHLIALDAITGEPRPSLRLKIFGHLAPNSVLQLDSNGQIHLSVLTDTVLQWTVECSSDSFAFNPMHFTIKPTDTYLQRTLEVSRKNKNSPTTHRRGSIDSIYHDSNMIVVADRVPLHERKKVSERTIHRSELRQVSSTQNDPFKVLGTLPGVANTSDLSVRPYVRGGDENETRTFWNGVPVLHPYHALSAYSIYNMEAIENMTIYTGGFPAEGNNSLSGALWLTSRPAPLDSTIFWTNLSLLKGHTYLGIPIKKEKFGIYIAYQAFWYDFMIKRSMEAVSLMADDSAFDTELDQYKKYIDLPNFKDLEFGFNLAINQHLQLDYSIIYAKDLFRILNASELTQYNTDSLGKAIRSIDTLALVKIPNVIHGLNLRYTPNSRLTVKTTLAYQTQKWDVVFDNSEPNHPLFDLTRKQIHARILNLYELSKNHLLNFGYMADYTWDKFDVDIPRFAYETLVRGSYDLMETIGFVNPNGYVITTSSPWNSVGEVLDQIMIDTKGNTNRFATGAWMSDRWIVDSDNRLDIGSRVDYESSSHQVFFSPRLSWFHRLNSDHEITLASGLYNQDNYEFLYRSYNPELRSEKAWHINAEYSWDISSKYRIEWSNYFKWYYDLVGIRLKNTGKVNVNDLVNYAVQFIDPADSTFIKLNQALYTSIDSVVLDSLANEVISMLPAQQQDILIGLAGERELSYTNIGHGYAVGTELALKYNPTKIWRGWLSVELSSSRRKDDDLDFWYNFRNHRPWAIKWHNYVDLPSNWEMSLRIDHSAGLAYTGFTNYGEMLNGWANNDTVMIVERKNNRRYAPTTRFDIRFERNTTLWGHPYKTYFELWNMFNSPNFLLLDSESKRFKWLTFSYPFPIIFSGIEFRW